MHISPSNGYLDAAATNLLSIVNEEISTERKVLEKLPKISSFDITLDGSIATLVRMYGSEEVKVQLNTNHTSESDVIEDNDGVYDHDEKDDEEEEYEEREVQSVYGYLKQHSQLYYIRGKSGRLADLVGTAKLKSAKF